MPTKEEIREKHLLKNGLSVNKSEVGKRIQKATYDAMDEFCKQECIEFSSWLQLNYQPHAEYGHYYDHHNDDEKRTPIPTSKLYKWYLKSKGA